MDNVRKFSTQVAEVQTVNIQLEHNAAQMSEQVMYMKDDWKREQELVVQLEKDLKFKEDQLQRSQDANAAQGALISHLQEQDRQNQQTIKNLQL